MRSMIGSMNAAEIVFTLLAAHGSPGATKFSIEVSPECATCKLSTFYAAPVQQERRESALVRYREISSALVIAARQLLCLDEHDKKIAECVPYAGLYGIGGARYWSTLTLSTAGAAIGLIESGYREDVQVGRGKSGKPSDDGGEGRGPSGEACFVQAHPQSAWRFADGPDATTLERAGNGDPSAREAVVQTMLGRSPEALQACWRTGLRMLIHSRAYCQWWLGANEQAKADGDFAMFSMYGTGNSCVSGNEGKTAIRTRQFRAFYGLAVELRKKP